MSGLEQIRETDRGFLWENLVLDELSTTCPPTALHYWRDKGGREVYRLEAQGIVLSRKLMLLK